MTQELTKYEPEVTYDTMYKIYIYIVYRQILQQTRLCGAHSGSPQLPTHNCIP